MFNRMMLFTNANKVVRLRSPFDTFCTFLLAAFFEFPDADILHDDYPHSSRSLDENIAAKAKASSLVLVTRASQPSGTR